MFKNKITNKLSVYFTISLSIFALFLGSFFILMFRNYTIDLNKENLKNKAVKMAATIPNYLEKSGSGIRGFGMYLNVINDLEADAVWIVDSELNLITGQSKQSHHNLNYEYKDLPVGANKIINEVLLGDIVFSEDFNSLLSEPSLTVGAPIINSDDIIIGVVLLHSPIIGVNQAIIQGIIILIASTLLALLVAFGLAIVLSRYFTKPLVTMNESALKLAQGNYDTKTNIKQNDEIGELAKTLNVLAKRLAVADKESASLEIMRREFIANISHELKTPVTVMRGSLEALVDEVVNDPQLVKEYHNQMLNEAVFLERLVKDLLELSQLQSLDFQIEKTKISMFAVIDDVIRSLTPIARAKNVKILLEKEKADYVISGDYGRIRQMLVIILDNAIKFSHNDSIVKVILKADKLAIKDQGIGILTEDLPYIFERFYKTRSEENKAGTGLGLAIAKNIASRHDIDLTVTSSKEKGTTFTFDMSKI